MSNTTRKPTKKENFAKLLTFPDVAADAELVDFINHEIELLIRKNSAERKPTAKQIAQRENDAAMREAIVAEMEADTLYSADDLSKNLPSIVAAGLSGPKVSYLMRELVASGKVKRVEDKRKVFYQVGA